MRPVPASTGKVHSRRTHLLLQLLIVEAKELIFAQLVLKPLFVRQQLLPVPAASTEQPEHGWFEQG